MKRGQIALFMIIALVLAFGIILLYSQREKLGWGLAGTNSEIRPMEAHVIDCLEKTSMNGVEILGLQGGYIDLPAQSFDANGSKIAYAYQSRKMLFPSHESIEKQIESYVEKEIPNCVQWEKWPDFRISEGKPNALALMEDESMILNLVWPITIEKGNSRYLISKFDKTVNVSAGRMYKAAYGIVNRTYSDPGTVDISYLISLGDEGIRGDIYPYNSTLVYSLEDNRSMVNGKPYVFLIAVKL